MHWMNFHENITENIERFTSKINEQYQQLDKRTSTTNRVF